MSERKVQSKYYPPDYDESKLPKQKKSTQTRIESRIMLPMSVQCSQCGEYLYRGKKFNAKKEPVKGEKYLNKIQIYRFFFRCTFCLNVITFITDPKNADYIVENGATRNFEPWKQNDEDEKEAKKKREAEDVDHQKMLENKSKDSKRDAEMDQMIENLMEQSEINHALIESDSLAVKHQQLLAEQEQDEREAKEAFERRKQSRTKQPAVPVSHSTTQLVDSVDELDSNQRFDFELDEDEEDAIVSAAELQRSKQELSAHGMSFGRPANDQSITQSRTQSQKITISQPALSKPPLPVLVKKRKAEVLEPTVPVKQPAAPALSTPALSLGTGLVAYASDSDSD